jgi:integrase
MARKSKGYSKAAIRKKGKWYGRLRCSGPGGKPKEYTRQARNKTHARQIANELEEKYVAGGTEALDAENMTFAGLVERFKAKRLIDPVYLGERKVAGYKHKDRLESRISRLVEYFGPVLLADLTLPKIEDYKLHLIQTPTKRKDADGNAKQRSPYDVNHQLRTLRLLLNFARRNHWIPENPFNQASEPLINPGDELPRHRPERPGELDRLIEKCAGPRAHVRPWIVTAVETALRPGEIDRLTRADVLFDQGVIVARATTTKTNRRREVPLTRLLAAELRAWLRFVAEDEEWSERVPDLPESPLFGGVKSNKKAFSTACRKAGIENLQRKDLRKWSTTRLVTALRRHGIPELHGMAITGHTRIATYKWYLNTDRATVTAAGDALDAERKQKQKGEQQGE